MYTHNHTCINICNSKKGNCAEFCFLIIKEQYSAQFPFLETLPQKMNFQKRELCGITVPDVDVRYERDIHVHDNFVSKLIFEARFPKKGTVRNYVP